MSDLSRKRSLSQLPRWTCNSFYASPNIIRDCVLPNRTQKFPKLPILARKHFKPINEPFSVAHEQVFHGTSRQVGEDDIIGIVWPGRFWVACYERLGADKRRDLAEGHCSDTLSNVTICVQKSGLPAWGASESLFA
jgi:hypothetical protein